VPPFGGVRGNVHGSSMARWKARGRLPISANWTFFASSHGWSAEQILVEIVLFERGVGHFEHKFQEKGGRPPPNFGVRKLESMGYPVVLFAWSYVQLFWYDTGVWHTDRHRDTRWWLLPTHRLRRAGKKRWTSRKKIRRVCASGSMKQAQRSSLRMTTS